MKLGVGDGALRCASLIAWVLWRPLDATGVGLKGGSFSVGRCSLEMIQLEKRDGVNRMCTSLAQLYAQLGESQKGEKRWIATAQHSQTKMAKDERFLRGEVAKLQQELSQTTRTFGQNEKLEMSVTELHELYNHQRSESKQNSVENEELQRRLTAVETATSKELKQAREAVKRLENVSSVNTAMHKTVNQETRLLKNLQKREDVEVAEIQRDRIALVKGAAHNKELQKLVSQYQVEMDKLRHQLYETALESQKLKQENAILRQGLGSAQQEAQGTEYLQQQVKALSSQLQQSNEATQSCQEEVAEAQTDKDKSLKQSALQCEKRVAQTLQECANKV